MRLLGVSAVLGVAILGGCSPANNGAGGTSTSRSAPASAPAAGIMPGKETTVPMKTAEAMFGAGCFWGVEETFRKIPGVIETAVGYAGGKVDSPTYKDVCTDMTGHAEVVHVRYDPAKVSYGQLLDVFWASHDPTQVNRQGPDYGSQYRSAVYYYSPEQKGEAEKSKAALGASGKLRRPVATEISQAPAFWKAEEYHQKYLYKRGEEACHLPGGE